MPKTVTVEVDGVVHDCTREDGETFRRVSALESRWVPRYRWRCSCGWRSTWRDHPRFTWQTARRHVVSGQIQAKL